MLLVPLVPQDLLVLILQLLAQRVLQALQGPQERLEALDLQVIQDQLVHKAYRAIQGLQDHKALQVPLGHKVLQEPLETLDQLDL